MAGNRRAKGDGSVFQRSSDGMYVGSIEVYSTDGKRRQKRVYAKTEGQALAKLQKLRADLARGAIPTGRTMKVGQWLDTWLNDFKKPHVAPNTFDWYEEAVRLHIKPHIGHLRLDLLKPQHARNMLNRANSSANAQRAHKTLKMALGDAVTDGLLSHNIMDAVPKPKHVKQQRDALSAAAAKTAIRTAIEIEESGVGPALATRWATAFLTGARPAEILGLEWDRVDFDNKLIDFSWQLLRLSKAHGCGEQNDDGTWPCGRSRVGYCPDAHWDLPPGYEYRECYRSLLWARPKSAAGTRLVPIVPPLLALLRKHAERGGPNPHNLVWREHDGRPITPNVDRKQWQLVREAAKLPRSVPLYTSRHTTGTLLQELGVPEEVRMQIMGHSSAAAHQSYIHIDQRQTRAALNKLGELLM